MVCIPKKEFDFKIELIYETVYTVESRDCCKNVDWLKIRLFVKKIHNFNPIIVKLG